MRRPNKGMRMLGLSKLSELARDGSRSGRKTLIHALTDLFVSSEQEQTEQVSIMFGEIVLRVLGQLEEETRMALAHRVGSHPSAPHDLVAKLAEDKFSIAEPVLRDSPVLTPADLEGVARSGSMDHLEAIASRDELAENVTEVLVDRGNRETLNLVAGNSGAAMADQTFSRLVEKARSCPDIQELLMDRKDIPKQAALALAGMLTDELKERITALGGDHVLAQVMAERAAEEVKARAGRLRESRKEAAKIIDEVVAGKRKLDDAVAYFAKLDRAAELGILLAKVSDLPAASVTKLVYGASEKPLIIICKANGVSASVFKHILTMRAKHLQTDVLALNDSLKRYDAMTPDAAMRSLETIRSSVDQPVKEEPEEVPERGAFMRSRKRPSKKKTEG